MKVLIVGGTGLTGATTAVHLAEQGYQVTLMSRNAVENPALSHFEWLQGDYIHDTFGPELLGQFDALVFAAGADIRMLPEGEADDVFFHKANSEAIPRFFQMAKQAGIKRAVYVGTYYPQVVPDRIETSAYVKSRYIADEAIRALSDNDFIVCSINAPFILGYFPGVAAPHLEALVHYCAGFIQELPLVAPEGGVNHISAKSMAQAIAGALERGESGKAYLVGDENLSWKQYFDSFCQATGNSIDIPVSKDEHPMLPDMILYAGRGATISYTPDNAPLNYETGLIESTINELVRVYLPKP